MYSILDSLLFHCRVTYITPDLKLGGPLIIPGGERHNEIKYLGREDNYSSLPKTELGPRNLEFSTTTI